MIVNPQVFNYRFTICTLVVAFTVLAAYSYNSHISAQSKEDFFKQEKKLLENQVSKVITSYDELGNINKDLKSELDNTKHIISQTKDSLEELQANVTLISKYRNELVVLKKRQFNLLKKEDSFSKVTNELKKQNSSISQILDNQIGLISNLKEENIKLDNDLKKGALVFANSFKVTASFVKNSGEIIETSHANKTTNFNVRFVLAENPLAIQQEKIIYVQIIDPDNNVVSDKGAINFNQSSLIYSYKTTTFYNTKSLEISSNIETNKTLKPGRYFVSAFDSDRRLGSTEIILN